MGAIAPSTLTGTRLLSSDVLGISGKHADGPVRTTTFLTPLGAAHQGPMHVRPR